MRFCFLIISAIVILISCHNKPGNADYVNRLPKKDTTVSTNNFVNLREGYSGSLNSIVLLIGLNALKDNEKIENLQEDLSAIEKSLGIKTITNINSETLVFRADMSLIQKQD